MYFSVLHIFAAAQADHPAPPPPPSPSPAQIIQPRHPLWATAPTARQQEPQQRHEEVDDRAGRAGAQERPGKVASGGGDPDLQPRDR